MRWKMLWINNYNETISSTPASAPETYGFKSKNTPPPCQELENFESDLLDLFDSIQFRNTSDDFQKKLKNDISTIHKSDNVYIFADKTTNIYSMPPELHDKLLLENVTKTYQKAPTLLETGINHEVKQIVSSYSVDNCAESLARSPAFVTLKDHKDNFNQKHPCRLINPCKSELGAISKSILDRVNSILR